jgi:hypothetical protein
MRKISFILICFIFLTFYQFPLLHSKTFTGNGNNLKYRFEYTIQGEAAGVLLLIFRYRVFFSATASVLLTAKKIDEKTFQFNFDTIDKTGYLILTRGFTGKTINTGAADYDLKKVQQILDKDFFIFKEKAPDFSRFVRRRKVFPFKILSRGKNVMTFKREMSGIHKDYSIDMKLKSVKHKKKDFYFKIYPMLLEMVKVYSHSFVPGNKKKVSELEPGMEWHSRDLDFTENMNGLGTRAAEVIKKFITFKQRKPFKLAYRVVPGSPGILTIHGEAMPQIKIYDGYKIMQVTRDVEIRLSDGVVLEDKFHVDIRNDERKCGFARCALTLVR